MGWKGRNGEEGKGMGEMDGDGDIFVAFTQTHHMQCNHFIGVFLTIIYVQCKLTSKRNASMRINAIYLAYIYRYLDNSGENNNY